ncbi:hypothetical protein DUNSADRAFT_4308 [Dunaliella salina]|uniref:Uncharacterized protein n=1 Tax=Dunaliella salina TaxID=3046 RepID=A0ABQ7H7M9_DUNSA|nr:hypothetical protein DUNSADRAFT_4308 [Dunaliella salina]|eukprot:KAF5842849.1 hypothetical protein DUNSADRAFT_4308 [Dunaliella salina]
MVFYNNEGEAERLACAIHLTISVLRPNKNVYTSGPLTLAGFSPFHTRTPEILGMGPLCQATESGFQAAFARYANIKQRFGK